MSSPTEKTDDGGPAFPSEPKRFVMGNAGLQPVGGGYTGMSLRDWFAAQALNALLPSSNLENDELARISYDVADAMLVARASLSPKTEIEPGKDGGT